MIGHDSRPNLPSLLSIRELEPKTSRPRQRQLGSPDFAPTSRALDDPKYEEPSHGEVSYKRTPDSPHLALLSFPPHTQLSISQMFTFSCIRNLDMAQTHAFPLLFILPLPLLILSFLFPLPAYISWVLWAVAGFAAWGFHRPNLLELVPGIFPAFASLQESYVSNYPSALVDVYTPDFSPPRVPCDCTLSGFCDPWCHDFKYVQIPMRIAGRQLVQAWR